jgi:hypothetical protein
MKSSKFFNLNWYDFLKGLAVAVFTAVVTGVLQMLTVVPPLLDAKAIGITAITAMLGYLLKQLNTNSNGELFNTENEK